MTQMYAIGFIATYVFKILMECYLFIGFQTFHCKTNILYDNLW